MNLRALLFPTPPSARVSAGLLLVRVFAGASLAGHGWGKIQNPLHWMDGAGAAPGVFQLLASIAEFFGGIALALGALSVVAAFGVFCTMVVAVSHHVYFGDPPSKWELAGVYLTVSLLLMTAGPGKFSVDARLQRKSGLG